MEYEYDEKITNVLKDDSFVSSYHFDLDSGYGDMIFYHLFEGIDLIYNKFNADDCNQIESSSDSNRNYMIINHCNKGRFETIFDDKYLYLSEGDLVFSTLTEGYMHEFPLGYYDGFQITIDLNIAQNSVDQVIGEGIINLNYLVEKINDNGSFVIIRSNKEIENVISQLYTVNNSIKEGYYKLKVMELLLFLKNFSIMSIEDEFPTLSESNVKIIKNIKSYLIEHIDDSITLDDLSSKFNISKTSIKTYFKTIYGKPLNTWRREYRLIQAAKYLENTTMNIGEIGEIVGYKNHGKFTDAFKQYYSMTPSEYRNSH